MMEQIDRFYTKEEEMKELITGLDDMTYELAQEVRMVSKDTRAAERLHNHWKKLSQKRQAKLVVTRAARDVLKDEVARLAKMKDKKKTIIAKYEAIANESQDKRN